MYSDKIAIDCDDFGRAVEVLMVVVHITKEVIVKFLTIEETHSNRLLSFRVT